jgi:hypothetical protein
LAVRFNLMVALCCINPDRFVDGVNCYFSQRDEVLTWFCFVCVLNCSAL